MVYEPAEDSWLLAGVVRERARGRVIDVGTGSGVQALAALENPAVSGVVATDIDDVSVEVARSAGVDALRADLFPDGAGCFDTIVCNPPYLPNEDGASDVALDGGPRGFEWTLRFLERAQDHLSRSGKVLLLVSSRTNPGVIDDWLLRHGFVWSVVSSEKAFFEELFVYEVLWALPRRPSAMFLAKGRRSRVYRESDTVIKVCDVRRARQEALLLRRVNALGIGPRLLVAGDSFVEMEYVDGVRLDRFVAGASASAVVSVLEQIFSQLAVLDREGINKDELTNPYKHVIVRGGVPVLIDWERAKPSPRPQNVAQFCEYVRRLASLRPDVPVKRFLRYCGGVP